MVADLVVVASAVAEAELGNKKPINTCNTKLIKL